MNFSSKISSPTTEKSSCLIIGIHSQGKLTPTAKLIDKASKNCISKIIQLGDFTGESGETLLLHGISNLSCERLLLVGCGKETISEFQYQKIILACVAQLKKTHAKEVISYLSELHIANRDLKWKIKYSQQLIAEQYYRFDSLKSKPQPKSPLNKFIFHANNNVDKQITTRAIAETNAIISGINLTRDLGNLPSNICTPTYLAKQALELAKDNSKIKVDILDEKELRKLGMNALLAVSQGSVEPAKLITIYYHGGNKSQKPVALVGKGITFDSGGLWLKPAEGMFDMKFDMCGGAAILGIMKAVSELKLPLNIVGVIAAAENMPSGSAVKTGDIVKSMSGQTIEIINTDAEGRLVLCDALTFCEKFKPEIVIDIATLTGAVIITLGPYASGLFCSNEQLSQELLTAANESQDHVWPLPIWDVYQERLNSNCADLMNVTGDRVASATMAACFLARFTKNYTWAHLDIAGVANTTGKEKSATGRPVALLIQYLQNKANNNRSN